jgi:hypothetical protein
MIGKITSIQELRLEILRRKTLSDSLSIKINNDYKGFKESANPLNLAKNAFSNNAITTSLISSVLMFGIGYFAKNKIFNKTSGIAKSALSFVIPKVASAIASQTSQAIFSKIKSAMQSTAKRGNDDLVKE